MLREVIIKSLKLEEGEKAYFLKAKGFCYECVVIPSEPEQSSRIIRVSHIEFVDNKNYKQLYRDLLERYDDLDAETCYPRSNY